MSRIRLIHPREMKSTPGVALSGLTGGLGFGLLFVLSVIPVMGPYLISVQSSYEPIWFQLAATVLVGLFITMLRQRVQLVQPYASLVLGASFAIGFVSVPLLQWVVLYGRAFSLTGIGAVLLLVVIIVTLSVPFGRIVLRCGRKLVRQDGTLCPGCHFSLIGNTSLSCPECGRAFTFDELGTTRTEFYRRSEAAWAGKTA